MLGLMNQLWTEDDVTFVGKYFRCEEVSISPKPKQSPLPVWIGGNSKAAIERPARYGHGWIGGSVSLPDTTGRVVTAIRGRSDELGRPIPDDHYGVGFNFRFGGWGDPIVERTVQQSAARAGGAEPDSYMAVGDADAIVSSSTHTRPWASRNSSLRPLATSKRR